MKTCMALSSGDIRPDLTESVEVGRGAIVGDAGGEVMVAMADRWSARVLGFRAFAESATPRKVG